MPKVLIAVKFEGDCQHCAKAATRMNPLYVFKVRGRATALFPFEIHKLCLAELVESLWMKEARKKRMSLPKLNAAINDQVKEEKS